MILILPPCRAILILIFSVSFVRRQQQRFKKQVIFIHKITESNRMVHLEGKTGDVTRRQGGAARGCAL